MLDCPEGSFHTRFRGASKLFPTAVCGNECSQIVCSIEIGFKGFLVEKGTLKYI